MENFFLEITFWVFTYDMKYLIQRKSSYEKGLKWKPYKRQKELEVSV